MIEFTQKEQYFLNSLEECRIATAHNNIPHVKPVSYYFENNTIYIATDYDTRMYKNLKENPTVALTIDVYKHNNHRAILVQGNVVIIENGEEFAKVFKKFHQKFEWVRHEPWGENEAPFIKIIPKTMTSWGLD